MVLILKAKGQGMSLTKEQIYQAFLENPAGSVHVLDEDATDPKQKCGVPLGGVGTGKIEITPDGVFRHFTINNNYVFPLDGMPGTFLAISAGTDPTSAKFKVLATESYNQFLPKNSYLKAHEIQYRGLYPLAFIEYKPGDLPVKVRLRAFAPIFPNDLNALQLPVAYFLLEIQNTASENVSGALHFSWEDINGCWGSKVSWDDFVPPTEPYFAADRGLLETFRLADRLQAVTFHRRESHPEVADFATGNYCVATTGEANDISVFQYDPNQAGPVQQMLKEVPQGTTRVKNQPGEFAAVLSRQFELAPGERRQMQFMLGWYTPNWIGFGKGDIASRVCVPQEFAGKKIGHAYTNRYISALDVVQQNFLKAETYLTKIEAWHSKILDSTLPHWLQDMLINNNYILSATMYWAKDGRFSILESPNCPCVGTLDQRFYGSPATMLFCPELEHNELMRYAKRSDEMFAHTGENKGQIYHDFGNNRLDALNAYGFNWIDLNPKFVLLCWRNYLMTGNRDNLTEIYDKILEAMERELVLDQDGDFLPEGYGNCNTYEGRFFGANSYDGSLWLAALKVFPQIARLMRDEKNAVKFEEILPKARQAFEEKLWRADKQYFIKCTEKQSVDPNDQCRDDQLTGQWYAQFLNEGLLLTPEKVNQAILSIERILKRPISDRHFIIRQEEFQKDRAVTGNWPGYSPGHFSSLAIYNGQAELGLDAVRGIYEILFQRYNLQWDQPLGLDTEGHPRGDRYMNSPVIWYVLWALEGFFIDIESGVLKISPNIPAAWKSHFKAPIATSKFWGEMLWQEKEDTKLSLVLDADFPLSQLIVKNPGAKLPQKIEFSLPAFRDFFAEVISNQELKITFPQRIVLRKNETLRLKYN